MHNDGGRASACRCRCLCHRNIKNQIYVFTSSIRSVSSSTLKLLSSKGSSPPTKPKSSPKIRILVEFPAYPWYDDVRFRRKLWRPCEAFPFVLLSQLGASCRCLRHRHLLMLLPLLVSNLSLSHPSCSCFRFFPQSFIILLHIIFHADHLLEVLWKPVFHLHQLPFMGAYIQEVLVRWCSCLLL